jgi:hypothetical protein
LSSPLANNPPAFPEPPALPATFPPPPPRSSAAVPPTPAPTGPARRAPEPTRSLRQHVDEWLDDSGILAWISSAVVHAALLVILALILLSTPSGEPLWVTGGFDVAPAEDLEMDLSDIPLDPISPSLGPFANNQEISIPGARSDALGTPASDASAAPLGSQFPSSASIAAQADRGEVGNPIESFANPLAARGGGLEGRNLANRRATALAGGGTLRSEAAVEAALKWFAEHQWPDGGWRFDLDACPNCKGQCRNAGSHQSSTAATGLALLCYLGAGYTHEEGKYQEVVSRGLYFLQEKMIVTSHGGDLRDSKADMGKNLPDLGGLLGPEISAMRRDTMYSQGIASLALTEAYAMTRDRGLREPAELAVKFVLDAQYRDGGWRYTPNWEIPMAGDATVSGWQIAVLKSATLAGIDVPYDVWLKISMFLDSIQFNQAQYLYLAGDSPTRHTAATPIGLLCRMIGGWSKEYRPLQQMAAAISEIPPKSKDVYFNYYASQVLHHLGGPNWEKWNPRMREHLVSTQETEGHEAGSWYVSEVHSSTGGRLYTTAMATMTLEVYYRYMPLYKEAFVDRTPNGAMVVEPEMKRERRD